MTTLITKRKKFQRAFIACAAFGLAGLLLAACEREEETALGQAEQPDECEITGQAMSRKIALPAGSFTMGAHPVYGEEGPFTLRCLGYLLRSTRIVPIIGTIMSLLFCLSH